MKNHISLILGLVLLTSCAIDNKRAESNPNTTSEKLLAIEQEVSLAADRDALNKLRDDTPAPIKQDNDELAYILDYFKDIRSNPSTLQSRFDRTVRRKQEIYRKRTRKLRENFTKQERKDREKFLESLKDQRERFLKNKVTSDQRKDFFDKQDEQRKEYFANSRDKRNEFESQMRASQRDQDAYFREKKKIFREEMTLFKKRQREWKQEQKEKAKNTRSTYGSGSLYPAPKASPQKSNLEKEFDALYTTPAQSLGAEEK